MLAIHISHACSRLLVVPPPHLQGSPVPLGLVMPRQARMQNTAALEEGMASLTQSLQSINARLHQERKRNRKRSARELSARRRHVQEALTILILHDSDRRWLPAFMRKHGMSGVGEELSAFDEEVCSSFQTLSVKEINTMRDPPDRPGQTRLRQAKAFITEQQVHAWVADQNERHGIAPTIGDTLQHRDELSATQNQEMHQAPLWSVQKSARFKWASRFRRRWRMGFRKPHAREAVPLEIAREKARQLGYSGKIPSQFTAGWPPSISQSNEPTGTCHPMAQTYTDGTTSFRDLSFYIDLKTNQMYCVCI